VSRKAKVRPCVGAGINFTTFFNEDFNDTGKAAGLSDLSLKDSWGAAGQVGLDYLINRDWLLNMSVWYMDIDTDVKFKAGGVDQKVSTVWIRGCLCSPQAIGSKFFCKTPAKSLCKTGHYMTSFFHSSRVNHCIDQSLFYWCVLAKFEYQCLVHDKAVQIKIFVRESSEAYHFFDQS
jgi:hypothetical protein